MDRSIDINVPVLARVEGEGALELRIDGGEIEHLRLRIYEPPRLFEKLLVGRSYTEVPDIVARICGICPVAYQMSAVQALEAAFGIEPGPWVQAMRRVLYCGEWIQSHALHIHLLAAPDFLGYDSVTAMAADHAEAVRRGLRIQAAGNRIMRLFGGRSVHPVGVRVGGFYRAPAPAEVEALRRELESLAEAARELVTWAAALNLPDDEQDFCSVALRQPDEYAMYGGRLVSSEGLDIDIQAYTSHFREHQVPHSTALHAHLYTRGVASGAAGVPYLVGPLARANLNWAQWPEEVRSVVAATGIAFPSRNMFHSIVARAAEIYYVVLEAAALLNDYAPPRAPAADVTPQAGVGVGCTEAPRGSLWHRYEVDADGRILNAMIVPPTSQNQARIEQDLQRSLIAMGLDRSDDALRRRAEAVIRNYDPCISCSTHFLRLAVERR